MFGNHFIFKIGFLWEATFFLIISDYKLTDEGSYNADNKQGSISGMYSDS